MIKNVFIFISILLFATSFSQIGGKSVYQFLSLVTSPRQAALGGKVLTIYDDDVNQGIYNPASINPEMDNHLSVNYGSYFGEVTYGTAAYAYTYDRHVQTFHAGVNYVNYGKFEGYDANGQKTNTFTGSEIALSFGYAYNLPYTNWHLGGNAKLISSTLESYQSYGAAIDLGATYLDEENDINYSLVLRNIGTQIKTYSGTNEKIPFEIQIGISKKPKHIPLRLSFVYENVEKWDLTYNDPLNPTESIDPITGQVIKQNKYKAEASVHQSKGVYLTQNRLDLDNLLNERDASIQIIDKKDEHKKAKGTTVILSFREY